MRRYRFCLTSRRLLFRSHVWTSGVNEGWKSFKNEVKSWFQLLLKSSNTSPSFTELSQSEIEFVLASALLCDVIGEKISHHFINMTASLRTDLKLFHKQQFESSCSETITFIWKLAFLCYWYSHREARNYFGFGITTLDWNVLVMCWYQLMTILYRNNHVRPFQKCVVYTVCESSTSTCKLINTTFPHLSSFCFYFYIQLQLLWIYFHPRRPRGGQLGRDKPRQSGFGVKARLAVA